MAEAPSRIYLNTTLPAFYLGNFNDTLNLLNNRDLRNAVKIPLRNQNVFLWLDSLCYWTLQGECHYQMARYDDALRAFNSALQIYFDQSDWLKSITTVSTPVMLPRQPLPWGASTRVGNLGNFSQCQFQMTLENLKIVPAGDQGIGISSQKTFFPIQAEHIIQCIALTIRRRTEILGSLSKYDPDTKQLENILAGRPCLPGHFTSSWVDVLHGLTLSALGDNTGAETALNRGLLMAGTFDHHLTPAALNELGNIALRKGEAETARTCFLEASYSAHQMGDPVLLGETFRNMANAHRLIQKSIPFPPISQASVFFRSAKDTSPMTLLPILHEEAESYIDLRRIPEAETINELSAAVMKRTKNGVLADSVHGARYHYLAAMIDYAKVYVAMIGGRTLPSKVLLDSGNKHLGLALDYLQRGTLRLYQLDKLEAFFQGGMITARGPITERVADELYDELLRDSTDTDWTVRPMDSFAALVATPPGAYERWFAVAYQRGNREKAFEISEKARQARFFANLPLGESRLTAFRLLFEREDGLLTPEMLLQRQTLALEFGEFEEISNKVRDIKRQLIGIPVVPQNPDQLASQKSLFAELQQQSAVQESVLRVMALSRSKPPQIFPPTLSLNQIREELPEGTSILTFVESLGNMFGFLIDKNTMSVWKVQPETPRDKALHVLITDYLRDLGNTAAGQQMDVKDLADQEGKWKTSGAALLKRLLGNTVRSASFTELVIVPTGTLWYVPFDAMSVQVGEQFRPLLTASDTPLVIRYAPTASLGVPMRASRGLNVETLVMCGKLMSRDTADVSLGAVTRFAQSGIQNLAIMDTSDRSLTLPASASAFASRIQQLVVLDNISLAQPLAWSPFANDRTKAANPVATWLELPWGGPSLVVLPGFHTPAENSLKTGMQNGDDLFLSAMLLEACGARTVLISRWRTGGRVSYDLTEQFLSQLSSKPAAEAWRQAILEVGGNPIKLEEEPRVRKNPKIEEVPIANHPFFWGAFILIDRGEHPETE